MSTPSAPARPWADAWRAILDQAGASAARRIQRGQALARRGAVGELTIAPGLVGAVVHEGRSRPDRVRIERAVVSDECWEAATAALRSELRFTAALLDGELPEDLERALADAGVEVVPELAVLTTTCSCAEREPICRHVAAVHDAAAALVGREPTWLLTFAGRDPDQLLRAVRRDPDAVEADLADTLDVAAGLTAARGDLDDIELRPAPAIDPASLVRHLGPPPGAESGTALEALVERAAATAWRLAAGDGADAADEELLLAELRAQRVASATALAEALGREVDDITAELDRLFTDGVVMRTGSGPDARYRAAGN